MPLASILVAVLLATSSEVIVLRSGERIPVQEILSREGGQIVFRDTKGVLYSLPLNDGDSVTTVREEASKKPEPAEAEAEAGISPHDDKMKLAVSAEEKERLLRTLEKTARRGTPPVLPEAEPEEEAEPGETEPGEAESTKEDDEEQRWRARAQAARDRVAQAEAQLDEAIRHERALNDFLLYVGGASGNADQHSNLMNDLADTRDRIPRLREAVDEARQALSDLQTEANRAGVLPGWLR